MPALGNAHREGELASLLFFLSRDSIAHALLEGIKGHVKISMSYFIIFDHCFLVKVTKIMHYDVG